MAAIVILVITSIAVFGVKQSAMVNNVVTGIAIVVIIGVIFGGIPYIHGHYWTDNFMPYQFFIHFLHFLFLLMICKEGPNGVFLGAATVFFSYIGFDSVANLRYFILTFSYCIHLCFIVRKLEIRTETYLLA